MSLLTWLQTAELPDYEHRDTLVLTPLILRCHNQVISTEVLLYLAYITVHTVFS